MSKEIIIELDRKKIAVLGIFVSILIFSLSSYFFALLAFDAPSPDFPLKVNQVETLNYADNATKTVFNKGETVRINITVEKALRYVNFPFSDDYFDFSGDTTCRVIVSVMDNVKSPVFIDDALVTISVGGIETVFFDYPILMSDRSGQYQVKVLLWTDWLPTGEALSSIAGEVTFDVN